VKASTNSQVLKEVAVLFRQQMVGPKVVIPNFGHPKKIACHDLEILEPFIGTLK